MGERQEERAQGTDRDGGQRDTLSGSTGAQGIPGIQELLGGDLAQLAQILPEQTRVHLKNAGTEAALALYHLWRGIDSQRQAARGPKTRRHIDVE